MTGDMWVVQGIGDILIHAAIRGATDEVGQLLDEGADVNYIPNKIIGAPLLVLACDSNHIETAKLLLSRGARVNLTDKFRASSLIVTAGRGYTELTGLLLDHGANMNARNISNRCALMAACTAGHHETADYLMSRGAKNVQSAAIAVEDEVIPLKDFYASCTMTGDMWVVQGIGDILIHAAIRGATDEVGQLLDEGADVNYIPNKIIGAPPLVWACDSNHIETAKLLLSRGARVNLTDKFRASPLIVAAGRGYTELAGLLLDHGANMNARNISNRCALMAACTAGHHGTADYLMSRGAKKVQFGDYATFEQRLEEHKAREILARTAIAAIVCSIAGAALFFLAVFLFSRLMSEEVKARRNRELRLQELPVHRALLSHRKMKDADLMTLANEQIATVRDLDFDKRTAIDIILQGLNSFPVPVDLIVLLLEESLPPLDIHDALTSTRSTRDLEDALDAFEEKNDSTGLTLRRRLSMHSWAMAVQHDSDNIADAVEAILDKNRMHINVLANASDGKGRSCRDIAQPRIKRAILKRLNLHERYELKSGPPLHKSVTSLVVQATDHGKDLDDHE
eukprot:gene388-405_t